MRWQVATSAITTCAFIASDSGLHPYSRDVRFSERRFSGLQSLLPSLDTVLYALP